MHTKVLKPSTPKKPNPNLRLIIQPVRLNAEEMRIILGKAHQYCNGSIGKFMRYAAVHFVPKKEDLK